MLLWSQGLFPVSPIQLMSGCAGAGREHSQAASPRWPMEIFHAMDVVLSLWMGAGWGAAFHFWMAFSFLVLSLTPLLSWSSSFSGSSAFFRNFMKFAKVPGVRDLYSGTGCDLVIGWWENCILYCCFCIYIVIINSSITSITVSFLVLLNCPYLSPGVLLFVRFSSLCWDGRGGVSERLSGA